MKMRRICAVYFSPTGNTKKIVTHFADRAGKALSCPVESYDFTKKDVREKGLSFSADDLVVVGSPTNAGKLPNLLLPQFKTKLAGGGAAAVAVATFGNRAFENSLAEMVSVLAEDGFFVVAGMACVGRHYFAKNLAVGRPDEHDFSEISAFAVKVAERLAESEAPVTGGVSAENTMAGDSLTDSTAAGGIYPGFSVPGDAAAPYYVPKGIDGEPVKFLKAKPKTDPEKCTDCGICANVCPLGSISRDDFSDVPGICIKCQACVQNCPTNAKYFDDPALLSHIAMLEKTYGEPKKNAFFM